MVERVYFREGQRLRAQDLDAEQQHRLAMQRWHHLGGHRWGIVFGLTPTIREPGVLVIDPGLAVDGYGRLLVVDHELQVDVTACIKQPDIKLYVYLLYQHTPGSNYRWSESVKVRLSSEQLEIPDEFPLRLPFESTPPDDPGCEWPVLVGVIQESTAVDRSAAAFPPAVGDAITTPSGAISLKLLASLDPKCFEPIQQQVIVRLPGADGQPADYFTASELHLDNQRLAEFNLNARAAVQGPLTVDKKLVFDEPIVVKPDEKAPPRPFQIYRLVSGPEKQREDELRIELYNSADPNSLPIPILTLQDQNQKPALTIRSDGTLVIANSLVVQEGRLRVGYELPDPDDPAYEEFIEQLRHPRPIASPVVAQFTHPLQNKVDLTITLSGFVKQDASQNQDARLTFQVRMTNTTGDQTPGLQLGFGISQGETLLYSKFQAVTSITAQQSLTISLSCTCPDLKISSDAVASAVLSIMLTNGGVALIASHAILIPSSAFK